MKLHLPVKLRASLLAAVIAVPALLYGKAFAGTGYVAPSNEFGWDTNDITLNQRYNQTAGNTYTATATTYTVYEMYGDLTGYDSGIAKVRVGYSDESCSENQRLVYQGGQYGTVSVTGEFTPVSTVYFKETEQKEDTASIIVKADAPTGDKYISYIDGSSEFTSDEMVFENSLQSGVNPSLVGQAYEGDVKIVTDAIKVNNAGSDVVLEDVDILGRTDTPAEMKTELGDGTKLVILNGNDNLTDGEKDTLNIANVENNNVYKNETPRTVELGDVSGKGSLVIVGNKERTEATKNEAGAITQGAFVEAAGKEDNVTVEIASVDGLAELGVANANLTIEGSVVNVTTTTLVNSATTVDGEVSTVGLNVNGESTLTATGDIKNIIGQGATGTQIDGQVISKEGEISLTNGSVNEGAIVRAESASRGDVTLSNIESEKAAEISAGHDLTLTENTVVNGVQEITIGNDLTVETGSKLTNYEGSIVAPGNITVSDDSSISDIGGNVEAGGDLSLEGDSSISGVDGSITAGGEGSTEGNITVSDGSSISGVGGNVEASGDLSLDNSSLTDVTGTVDVDGDMSVQNGSKVDNLGGLDVEGSLTIDNSTVTDVANGEGVVGEVGNGNDGDSLTIQNGGSLSNSTLNVNGDIIVDGATLTSSTITATGKLEAKNGAILSKGDVVGEDGEMSSRDNVLTVAQDSVITSGSQVSGTDLTVTSETGDPNLEISGQKDGHATTVTGDTNLKVDGAITVDDGAELSLEGGEGRDASLTANTLNLRELSDDRASISDGSVAVEAATNINSGNELQLKNTTGTLGSVVEDKPTESEETKLAIIGGSEITASGIGTSVAGGSKTNLGQEYFDQVVVDGDSSLTVKGTAAIADYDQGGSDTTGSKTTIDDEAWLANASITGTGTYDADQGTETTLKSDAHIGSLTIAKEGALSFVGADNDNKTESYIARLTQTSDGHINVVNSVLTTPELHGENISLGLNGGTVVLGQVEAQDGATVGSVDQTNAHVLVGEITNASATGAPDKSPHGQSTIQTTVDRVTSEYSFSKGDPATATVKTYVFIARKDGTVTVNGQEITVVAGQEVRIADTYLNEATEYPGEDPVSTGVTTVDMAEFIADNQGLLDPKLVGVVDGDGKPVCDNQGDQLMAQVIEKGDTLTFYPDAQQSLGTLTEVSDGIASLTVKGDFDADNTLINAYLTGAADENGHVIADADSGLITIEGVLSGQDNTLNADVDVSIGGIVSKDGAAYEAANKVTALTGDIAIGEEGIVGSSNVLSATNGKITVTGAIEGNSNDLDAKLNIETGSITGDDNMLTSTEGSITTGAIDGDSNDLDAKLNIETGSITGDDNMLTSTEGSITTGAIDGDSNDLDAKLNIVTGSITGDSNMLTSETGTITTDAIVGDSNILDANGDITVDGSITGDSNVLDSETGSITTGAITGDGNMLTSEEGAITTGAIVGNSNDLDAVDSITVNGDIDGSANDLDATGNITVHGSIITGGLNEETGNKLTSAEGSITVEDGISGHFNDLNAKLDIVTGPISGNSNTLTSWNDSITVGADDAGNGIGGSNNVLTAEDATNGSITVDGAIAGNDNTLTAGTTISTGDISGIANVLTAGESIETGAITGGQNKLTAGTTITTKGDISSFSNTLIAQGDITVEGNVSGTGHSLTSVDGDVIISEQLGGTTNQVKGETIDIGSVTGNNQTVLSYGAGLSPDDVAIHIGEFNAQGSTVAIATGTDPVMGQASGNGAIVIDEMSSVGGDGPVSGTRNTISSNISSVYIGSLNNYDAYTLIEAHDDIVVGSLVDTHGVRSEGDKAFNQTWKAENLIVNSAKGLTLVNSALTMTGSISGGDLTLELEQPADGTIYVTTSRANSVTLNSLTLVNGAQLKVLGKADIEYLTLDGKYSALDATTTEINELTLANGASYNAGLVIVNTLNIDNSSMSVVTLAGVKEISLVDNAVLAITGVDGKTDLTGDLSVAENSKLLVTFDLKTEGSITSSNGSLIQAANITAGDGLVSDGGTIKTTSGDIIAESGAIAATQGGTIEAVGDITAEDGNITADNGTIYTTGKISAEKGNLIASNGSELTAGKGLTALGMDISASTVVGNVTLTGNGESFIKDASRVEGSITLSGGNITVSGTEDGTKDAEVTGSITGATNATLTNATVGNLTASGVVSLTNADTGWIKDAASVSMADASTVTGDITMAETNTGVTMDHSTLQGSIIGAVGATLENASLVTGNLDLAGGAATIKASTVHGTITGADTVTVSAGSTVGNISEVSGKVDIDDSTTGNIATSGDVELTNAHSGTISGTDVSLSGGSSSGAITATGTVGVEDSTVNGTISGTDVTVTGGSASGAITASGTAKVDGSTVEGTISGANVTVTGGSETGAITAENTVTVNGSEVQGTISAGGLVDLDNATVGNVTSTDGLVDLNGSHAGTISGANVTLTNGSSSGAITATTGAATVTDSTVEGDLSAAGTATVTGSTVEGTISGTDVTVTGGSASGAITASGTAKVDGSTVEGTITAGGLVDLDNATVGNVQTDGEVELAGSHAGTIGGTNVSLEAGSSSGAITASGTVGVDASTVEGTISGATSLEMSNGAVVNGDVSMADGNTGVTMDGSTIHGSISNAGKLEITNQSMVTGNVELVGDAELSISDSTVAGTVSGAKSVELTNTSTGDVSVENKVTLDNADTGSINANSLESINGSTVTGNVTLTGGAANLTDTVVTGSITGAGEVTLANAQTGAIEGASLDASGNSTVTGDVTLAGGAATVTDSAVTGSITGAGEVTLSNAQTGSIEGDSLGAKDSEITCSVTLDGGNAELSNTDVAGDITGAADVTMSAGLVGSIDASGNVSLTEVSSTGTVDADGSVSLNASQTGSVTGESLTATNASTVSGDVTLAGGDATVTDSAVTGAITGAGDVTLSNAQTGAIDGTSLSASAGSTVTGDVTLAGGDATVTDSAVTGAITGAGDVTLSNAQTGAIDGTSLSASAGSTVTGDVTLAGGDATVTDSIVTGSITGAANVTVDQSTTGDITGATGDVALSDALVGTVQTAGDLSVDGTVKSDGSVSSDGLSVAEFGSLTAQGDVTADGLINIDGALTSATGSVSLTGAEGSSISADVTAGKDVTLGGTIAAQDSSITGENIVVNGTLDAAEGVALNGTVSGLGTINKTGGDDLVLAADTNMSGGAVNVSDGSTLKAEGGHMGNLAVTDGSTLVVGGDSEVATEVKADSLTMDASSSLQSTVNLAAGAADRVTVSGTTDLGGATLVLDGLKSSEEGAVADGTRFTVVQGSLQNSGLAEDVVHDLDKLNAHVENFGDHSDLVLSKNYKGADKTPNQTQVAGALASIDPEAVAGTQLGEVLDALAHTRSEADAKAALDSLGGAGLTAMQKMIADESHEHMQTFRSTFSSLSSGIDRRIDASGSIIPGVNSSAVTVTMTGGVTDVSGDQNIGDYRRSSCGFMLAGAHAVTENWTFGADFAYSAVTGKCTGIDVDADAYFVDLAMRYDNKRFHQMATLGAGFFGFDTKRFVSVKAQGHDFSGIADGSTTAASFNISYEASYDLIVSEDGHHVFSPVVMAEASFAQIKGMTEGGIGNAGLYSEADDVQSLTVGAGARYTFVYGEERNPGFISAEALAMGYAGDDSMTVRNAFIGGGPYFELKGPKAGNAGLRLNLNFLHPLSDKWSVTGNATAEFRSGQSGVGGAIGVKYSF